MDSTNETQKQMVTFPIMTTPRGYPIRDSKVYEKIKIDDLILIPKGTSIWSIKLQQTIILYNDIIAKITNTTTGYDSVFVMPQIKNIKLLQYIDFSYDKSEKLIDKPTIPDTYRDDTTFGELHYGFNEEEYVNNDRKMKLDSILD
jgi:hypothetical protein